MGRHGAGDAGVSVLNQAHEPAELGLLVEGREDDPCHGLCGVEAKDAAEALDDVDVAAAGLDEHAGVCDGDVDPLAQDADGREDTDRATLEPRDDLAALFERGVPVKVGRGQAGGLALLDEPLASGSFVAVREDVPPSWVVRNCPGERGLRVELGSFLIRRDRCRDLDKRTERGDHNLVIGKVTVVDSLVECVRVDDLVWIDLVVKRGREPESPG